MNKNNETKISILDQAKKHYLEIGTHKIEVPEWGNTVIYSKAVTIEEMKRIHNSSDEYFDRILETIIVKAEDENGQKLFKKSDAYDLKTKVSADVIHRIHDHISAIPTIKSQKKE